MSRAAGRSPLRIFNPREAPAEQLESTLVGRKEILEEILADLTRQASSASRQHWLIRGPRGIGKTHLMGVVYHRVKADRVLASAYLPIWLAETEGFEVYSAATLLLHVAAELAEELRATESHAAAQIDNALAASSAGGDDPALFDELAQLLISAANGHGRILLVLMENLDAILGAFPSRRAGGEAARLRSLLTHDRELLFLSTTPTRYLASLQDPGRPLFGQLRERTLRPLEEDEVGDLFRRLAQASGRAVAGGGVHSRLRRRVLHRLTGGNPRALVMAFGLLTGAPGAQAVVGELEALLDAQTAYFEARLARLAPRERAIVTSMALAPTNLTISEIARRTRLPLRPLSTQIKRMVEDGQLATALGSGGKGSVYELSDGLFRIWYQYRKGRRLLEPVVRFLAFWYDPEELEGAATELFRLADEEGYAATDGGGYVHLHVAEALRFARSPAGAAERQALWAACLLEVEEERRQDLRKRLEGIRARGGSPEALLRLFEEILAASSKGELTPATAAAVVLEVGRDLFDSRRFADSERLGQWASERAAEGGESAEELRGRALLHVGRSRAAAGRPGEALAVWEEVARRYRGREEVPLLALAARALCYGGEGLLELGRLDEALEMTREVVALFGQRQELPLAIMVARALPFCGYLLKVMGRLEDAVEQYDEVVRRYSGRQETPLMESVAVALFSRGLALRRLGGPRAAVEAYEAVAWRYGGRQEEKLAKWVARARYNRAEALADLGAWRESSEGFRELVVHTSTQQGIDIREVGARALLNCSTKPQLAHVAEELGHSLRTEGEDDPIRIAVALIGAVVSPTATPSEANECASEIRRLAAMQSEEVPLPAGFDLLLARGSLPWVEGCMSDLASDVLEPLGQEAHLYRLVAAVLAAEEPARGRASRPGDRRRRALARVPPELRVTVRERVAYLRNLRQKWRKVKEGSKGRAEVVRR